MALSAGVKAEQLAQRAHQASSNFLTRRGLATPQTGLTEAQRLAAAGKADAAAATAGKFTGRASKEVVKVEGQLQQAQRAHTQLQSSGASAEQLAASQKRIEGLTKQKEVLVGRQKALEGTATAQTPAQTAAAEAKATAQAESAAAAKAAEKNLAAFNSGSMESGAALKHIEAQAKAGTLTAESQAAVATYHGQAVKKAEGLAAQIAEKEKALGALRQSGGASHGAVTAMPGESLSGARAAVSVKQTREAAKLQKEIKTLQGQHAAEQKTVANFEKHLPKPQVAGTPTTGTPTTGTPTTGTPTTGTPTTPPAQEGGLGATLAKGWEWAKANPAYSIPGGLVGGAILGKTMLGGPEFQPTIYKAGSVNIELMKKVAYLEKTAGVPYGTVDLASGHLGIPIDVLVEGELTLEKIAILRNVGTFIKGHAGRGLGRLADETQHVPGLRTLSGTWKNAGGDLLESRVAFRADQGVKAGRKLGRMSGKDPNALSSLKKKIEGGPATPGDVRRYKRDVRRYKRLAKAQKQKSDHLTRAGQLARESDKMRGYDKVRDATGRMGPQEGSAQGLVKQRGLDAMREAGRGKGATNIAAERQVKAVNKARAAAGKAGTIPPASKPFWETHKGATVAGGGALAGGGLIAAGQEPDMVANVRSTKLAHVLDAHREDFMKRAASMQGKFLGISPKPPTEAINPRSTAGGAALKTVAKNMNKGLAKVERVPTFKGVR